ncbi:hypothetical protein G6F22_014184 [Rhizopus arrhizus]|nr:hypothetical protein G6F22_014184 [Rhizopus arrhizus]
MPRHWQPAGRGIRRVGRLGAGLSGAGRTMGQGGGQPALGGAVRRGADCPVAGGPVAPARRMGLRGRLGCAVRMVADACAVQ